MDFKDIALKLFVVVILYSVMLFSICKPIKDHWNTQIHKPEDTDITFFDALCYTVSNLFLVSHANFTPKSNEARFITLTLPLATVYILSTTFESGEDYTMSKKMLSY